MEKSLIRCQHNKSHRVPFNRLPWQSVHLFLAMNLLMIRRISANRSKKGRSYLPLSRWTGNNYEKLCYGYAAVARSVRVNHDL